MSEMRECPHCGGRGRTFGVPEWGVVCEGGQGDADGCGASVDGFLTEDDAIAAWNRRVPTPAGAGVTREWLIAEIPAHVQLVAGDEKYLPSLADAILERLNSPPDDGWLTIDSAPSDGSLVLTFGGRRETVTLEQADGDWWRQFLQSGSPTRWRPLPQPPEAK